MTHTGRHGGRGHSYVAVFFREVKCMSKTMTNIGDGTRPFSGAPMQVTQMTYQHFEIAEVFCLVSGLYKAFCNH